ncbi:hypothetical protein EV649_7965 [Kribbella sp. VKM Ac-2569]|uniref:hypothetical protein n=1 Tax=Kribbella sp. VKM Ac-2569 TaxID=2512220 RepID=UPI00102C6007|nr:hypothetical protein [Kribbella sp. VKM Ac-2569]RZT07551.1 hypothetical protein EV649_7965 [Kribbella sp. VKM Ac-2569]
MTARDGRRTRTKIIIAAATAVLTCLITGVGAASAAPAGSPADPVLSLPSPTGPYAVGVRSASVSDPSRIDGQTGRPRRLPIRVWYPARGHATGNSAPYLSPGVQAQLEAGLPTGLLDIDTHASTGARPLPRVKGVILVQHGAGTLAAFQTGQVIELASRGYALVTMEHPHESLLIEEPDGTLIPGDDPESRPPNERLLDAEVVMAEVPRLVPQANRRTPIGMFGHSRGGATTAEVMFSHPQVVAGVDLDGSLRGDVVTGGLDQPFGLMLGREFPLDDPRLLQFLSNLRGPHPLRQLDVEHYGYTDWVVFNPQAARADPALGAQLEMSFPTGTLNDQRAGRQAMSTQREFLTCFMDRYLSATAGW